MPKKKKTSTPMEELTKNYEKFIKGKELTDNGKEVFEKVVKKIVKKKHDSK